MAAAGLGRRCSGRGGIRHGSVFLSLSFFVISKTHIVRELCGGECHFFFLFQGRKYYRTLLKCLRGYQRGPVAGPG